MDYEPFGDDWKKEITQMKKADIIALLAEVAVENVRLRFMLNSRTRRPQCQKNKTAASAKRNSRS